MDIFRKNPAAVLGLAITLIFLGFSIIHFRFLEAMELRFYDARMRMRGVSAPADEIVLVEIDNEAIEKKGQWPWPRSVVAKAIEDIRKAGPKIIGLNIIYSEPEKTDIPLDRLLALIAGTSDNDRDKLADRVRKLGEELDNDRQLAESLKKSGNVVLPVVFRETGNASSRKETEERLLRRTVTGVEAGSGDVFTSGQILRPIDLLFDAAASIGHVNLRADSDGTVRRHILLYSYHGSYYPSFALMVAAGYLDIELPDITARTGESLALGNIVTLPMTPDSELLVTFRESGDGNSNFKRYSFADLKTLSPVTFRNKIVLITLSASGIMNPLSTPTNQQMSVGEFTANAVWTILNRQFIREPSWGRSAEFILIGIVGLLVVFIFPRLRASVAWITFAGTAGLMIGGSIWFFVSRGLWIQVTSPLLQLIFGYIAMITASFLLTEEGKEKAEGESARTNLQLGLSLQSEGKLDAAFEKYLKVPMDDELKAVMYNLALDFERKRQFNKAAMACAHIEEHDPAYRDVAEKKTKLLRASDSMVYGDGFLASGSVSGDPLLSTNTDVRPTLGRYEIQKRLGKGAMGVVYLGLDPRINRTTAIKTFRFADDFEPDEAQKMKERFFREAESAGKLSHPNIVSIYDAGDEHDLAYISMEYLEGDDLQKYTRKNSLLPMRKVIDYVADIADALDYAHQNDIVHRDIKPANIMLLKSGVVKITDFGIARITSTSHTQTGVVKGTPHYMSPEQISGQRVTGQSDIFSLGTMLYQLLCGELPFRGDSPAALMYQITNVRHPDPRKFNPRILKPLVLIIDKALEKDRQKRYQRASHMAQHLKTLGAKIDAVIQQKKMQQQTGKKPASS